MAIQDRSQHRRLECPCGPGSGREDQPLPTDFSHSRIRQGRASQQSIVDRALFIEDVGTQRQGKLSLETAKLSEGFFEQLKKHPVPIEEAAIKAISNNPAALDVYLWLAYRLHVLSGDKLVTWKALKTQFGASYKELFHFKPRFAQAIALATAVYPDAKIEVVNEGVILKPSRPPVTPKVHAIRDAKIIAR
jgi:Plasmid encoded RepA protein